MPGPDYILVEKAKRLLSVFSCNQLVKSYTVDLGEQPIGKKEYEGDCKTPEGRYLIDDKNPNSIFFLNLGISYPSEDDIRNAAALGKSPGGLIKIHGQPNDPARIPHYPCADWTRGCIALSNSDMSELYELVATGTIIEIVP
ncbi:MAG: L,D-transpeptidase family protein [Bacteroidota bacterium]